MGPYFQTHLLARSVDVDKEEQQEVEEDADDPQQGQESLLRCAEVWTREVHVKHLATLNITQTDKCDKNMQENQSNRVSSFWKGSEDAAKVTESQTMQHKHDHRQETDASPVYRNASSSSPRRCA